MPAPTDNQDSPSKVTAEPKSEASHSLGIIVNPEETIGIRIEPVFISLGLKSSHFKESVGGSAD